MSTQKTIIIKAIQRDLAIVEKIPAAAFYPGHMLELTSADKLQKHSVAGGSVAPAMFALEDSLQGNTIDDAYTTSGRARGWIPQIGDEVQAILQDGQNIAIGDKLESAGDGTLQKHTSDAYSSAQQVTVYDKQIVGIAMEALDLSGSSGTESSGALDYDKRIRIMKV